MRLTHLSALACVALAIACAGEDSPGPGEFTIAMTVDSVNLRADGSDAASIIVWVLDANGNAPPEGSEVLLSASGGHVNGTTSEVGSASTDTSGFAEFQVSCAGAREIQAIAVFDGRNGFLSNRIDCGRPPESPDMGFTPRLDAGQTIVRRADRVEFELRLDSGRQVGDWDWEQFGAPAIELPSEVEVEIDAEGLVFDGQETTLRTTAGYGAIVHFDAVVISELGPARVCATLVDERFDGERTCRQLIVVEDLAGPACVATLNSRVEQGPDEFLAELSLRVWDASGAPMATLLTYESSADAEVSVFGQDPSEPATELATNEAGQATLQLLYGPADWISVAISGPDAEPSVVCALPELWP